MTRSVWFCLDSDLSGFCWDNSLQLEIEWWCVLEFAQYPRGEEDEEEVFETGGSYSTA